MKNLTATSYEGATESTTCRTLRPAETRLSELETTRSHAGFLETLTCRVQATFGVTGATAWRRSAPFWGMAPPTLPPTARPYSATRRPSLVSSAHCMTTTLQYAMFRVQGNKVALSMPKEARLRVLGAPPTHPACPRPEHRDGPLPGPGAGGPLPHRFRAVEGVLSHLPGPHVHCQEAVAPSAHATERAPPALVRGQTWTA